MRKKVLLVEPSYKSKYPPLGLMKISAFHKAKGDIVDYVKGINDDIEHEDYDKVYITSLFTYEYLKTKEATLYYKSKCKNAEVIIGGIYATLMPKHVESETGIKPHIGLLDVAEFMPPDYSLIPKHPWGNFSYVFTTRGCPNKCGFCAVRKLEPNTFINPRWKEHISLRLPNVMIHDNNLTSMPFDHFKKVVLYLSYIKRGVVFDNGFDCRRFSSEHAKYLSKLKLINLRFAFDTMKQDGYLQRTIEKCILHGIPASKIIVFVLFNYSDTLEEALYRAKEVVKLGARAYAMQYTPLNSLDSFSYYYRGWNKELCQDFSFFVNILRFANAMPFEEWRREYKQKRFKSNYKKSINKWNFNPF